MQKRILLFLVQGIICFQCFGQDEEEVKQKKVTHYVGIQANQLLRQLFSLSSANPAVNNPYLFTYSVNSNATGWGFSTGLGYTYNQFEEGDVINPLETTINDFSLRAGVERKVSIGKRWLAGFGMDLLTEVNRDKTVSKSPFGNFMSRTKATTFGMGPRFLLNFKISDRIMLGTEASYYFKRTKETQTITGIPSSTERFREFGFVVPAILFLNVTF